jgi:hypothetical protein
MTYVGMRSPFTLLNLPNTRTDETSVSSTNWQPFSVSVLPVTPENERNELLPQTQVKQFS